jgi:nucleotide-binding universal stress UspA family protein
VIITTVYVPLDGSERAETALRPAAAIAERTGADLVALSTVWPGARVETVERYLEARTVFFDHPARPRFVPDQGAADAIRAAAAEDGALVCMTTRGRGAVRKALFGSVSEEIARTASAPVLLVGPGISSRWELGEEPLVIAGLDGSRWARRAASDAGELAAALHGRVLALEAVRPSDVVTVGRGPEGDAAMLHRVTEDLEMRGVPAESTLVDAFDPAEALTREARERRAACIAVASHGRTGVARAVLGSVAASTVRHAPCPVLVSGPSIPRSAG